MDDGAQNQTGRAGGSSQGLKQKGMQVSMTVGS